MKFSFSLLLLFISTFAHAQLHLTNYALTHVTLIDANHRQPLPNQTVIIQEDKIEAIFTDGAKPIADSFTIFNLHGKFLIPGLIDTHVHLATDPSETDNAASTLRTLHKMLFTGITSVRDMAGDARVLAGLSRQATLGEIISPDIYYSALMAGPEFFTDPRTIATSRGGISGNMPYMKAISDSTNLVLAVAEAKGTGASGIKLYADLSARLSTRIIAEANRQHMRVWAHAWLDQTKPRDLVLAGVSSISHAYLLIYEKVDSVPEGWKSTRNSESFWKDSLPDNTALFKLMKEHHTMLDATLATYSKWSIEDSNARYRYEITKHFTAVAYQAGVTISAGTDDDQEGFVQNEMKLLVTDAGFTPIDALIAATLNGAKVIGIEQNCGTIEMNKLASLVVLEKNPLENIDNIKSVYLIIKKGRIYKN